MESNICHCRCQLQKKLIVLMRVHLLLIAVVFHVKKEAFQFTPAINHIQTFMKNEQDTLHPLSLSSKWYTQQPYLSNLKKYDLKSKQIRLRLIPHALRNSQVLYHVFKQLPYSWVEQVKLSIPRGLLLELPFKEG